MLTPNLSYANLKESYLFHHIAEKTRAYLEANPGAHASLRERFDIDKKNSSMISRLLNDTCAIGLIYISPDSTSDKNRKYLPFWA